MEKPPTQVTIGVDLGGTKCAAGLVDCDTGAILDRRRFATAAVRGPDAVLRDVIEVIADLVALGAASGAKPSGVGLGIAELVDRRGRVASGFTIDWRGVDVDGAVRRAVSLPLVIEADVRAAAWAEGCWGAGAGLTDFVFVTIGTGISAALVLNGSAYRGARGLTGTIASAPGLAPDESGQLVTSQPLEFFAAGPAIARRYSEQAPGFVGDARDVVRLADEGDPAARRVVESAGAAIGAAIGVLVNTLDPAAVVVGGGLGLVEGTFRDSMDEALRRQIWSDLHRETPLVSAKLGPDAGMLGAALVAADLLQL
jgi:glucokinase